MRRGVLAVRENYQLYSRAVTLVMHHRIRDRRPWELGLDADLAILVCEQLCRMMTTKNAQTGHALLTTDPEVSWYLANQNT